MKTLNCSKTLIFFLNAKSKCGSTVLPVKVEFGFLSSHLTTISVHIADSCAAYLKRVIPFLLLSHVVQLLPAGIGSKWGATITILSLPS